MTRATASRQPALVSDQAPTGLDAARFDQAQGIATPSYCAEMRRAHAKRVARDECQRAIAKAYLALEEAEAWADRIYMSEMDRINADLCHQVAA